MSESNQTEVTQGERLVRMETKIDGLSTLLNTRLQHIEETQQRDRKEFSDDLHNLKTVDFAHMKTAIKAQGEAHTTLLERKADAKDLEPIREEIRGIRSDLKRGVWIVLGAVIAVVLTASGVGVASQVMKPSPAVHVTPQNPVNQTVVTPPTG